MGDEVTNLTAELRDLTVSVSVRRGPRARAAAAGPIAWAGSSNVPPVPAPAEPEGEEWEVVSEESAPIAGFKRLAVAECAALETSLKESGSATGSRRVYLIIKATNLAMLGVWVGPAPLTYDLLMASEPALLRGLRRMKGETHDSVERALEEWRLRWQPEMGHSPSSPPIWVRE
jgi:hypothetical protein